MIMVSTVRILLRFSAFRAIRTVIRTDMIQLPAFSSQCPASSSQLKTGNWRLETDLTSCSQLLRRRRLRRRLIVIVGQRHGGQLFAGHATARDRLIDLDPAV